MQITPFLMFVGEAKAAIDLYVRAIPNSRIVSIDYYGDEGPGARGTVQHAVIELNGQQVRCIDSPPVHDFTFTPSMSLFIDCDTDEQVDTLYQTLSEEGGVLMPLDQYPFNRRYAWVQDRFGVSWQIGVK
ncbi:VOC family protein [Bordetella genomosp. 13]|uniref:PhnB-like domain-containing protein n=1 Tax=Bordetella genomosp. 13 TaxID=463040 RepID=A0A1W6Z7V7_9BORD|nr:VOC family protein [Bordetella genomosp. 13]ARP93325.1 hypothetical protein CAL15_02340 [Bordetella genomosp. 13]